MRNTDPTAGGAPRRRNRSAEDRNAENRATLAVVWSTNVWSTTKPRRATSVAPRSAVRRLIDPHWSSAVCHVAGVPGTPTDRPEVTASANGIGTPFSTKESLRIARGAVSRPSMVCTVPDAAS